MKTYEVIYMFGDAQEHRESCLMLTESYQVKAAVGDACRHSFLPVSRLTAGALTNL